jgi:hypothetical protein
MNTEVVNREISAPPSAKELLDEPLTDADEVVVVGPSVADVSAFGVNADATDALILDASLALPELTDGCDAESDVLRVDPSVADVTASGVSGLAVD